jgi:SseB protein N-terminal domain
MGFLDRFRGSRGPDEILERQLLVPTAETWREPGSWVLDEDTDVPFVVMADHEGRPVLPAFTSEAALVRWMPHGSPTSPCAVTRWYRCSLEASSIGR